MPSSILDVDGLKTPLVLLPVLNHANTAGVSSAGHHDNISNIELDEVYNLVGFQVKLDGIIGLDERVRVANGTTIVGTIFALYQNGKKQQKIKQSHQLATKPKT
ncbi:hypothetical protein C4D60_Mb01t07690 [Musa balbisiana]|uniref:Uncharacterized protein n=1 Tax=Musa balbisiana TaxID=52838 RepID=A0A4S8JKK8_MUSBA|nr:hypothetical protein C4D60_Mb01t07690 [Musa balbisiana]